MTRHIIDRGILATIHAFDGGGCVVLSRDGALADYTVTRGTACALASSGLLGADVEVCLTRAGETTPADGERTRYLAASADVARLERELADAQQTVRYLRALTNDPDPVVWVRRADVSAVVEGEAREWDDAARRHRDAVDRGAGDGAARASDDARLIAHSVRRSLAAIHTRLDAQRPHGPAADVERVVVAPDGEVVRFGMSAIVADGDGAVTSHCRVLHPHIGRRVRVVVELLPAAAVDAQDGVGEQRGEGVGQRVGVEHGASVATAAAPVKSRDGGAA